MKQRLTEGTERSSRLISALALSLVLGVYFAAPAAAQAPTVNKTADLPGGAMLANAMGWLTQYGFYACLAAIIAGGGVWGWSQQNGRMGGAHRGQMFIMGGVGGALVIGAAQLIIATAIAANP